MLSPFESPIRDSKKRKPEGISFETLEGSRNVIYLADRFAEVNGPGEFGKSIDNERVYADKHVDKRPVDQHRSPHIASRLRSGMEERLGFGAPVRPVLQSAALRSVRHPESPVVACQRTKQKAEEDSVRGAGH